MAAELVQEATHLRVALGIFLTAVVAVVAVVAAAAASSEGEQVVGGPG